MHFMQDDRTGRSRSTSKTSLYLPAFVCRDLNYQQWKYTRSGSAYVTMLFPAAYLFFTPSCCRFQKFYFNRFPAVSGKDFKGFP